MTLPYTRATIAQDDPITVDYLNGIKSNEDDLDARVSQITNTIVPNGSFESYDAGSPYHPIGWTWSGLIGGSGGSEGSQDGEGARNIYITAPGGAGNGGGSYTSGYVACTDLLTVRLKALYRASAATMHNTVELLWYNEDKTAHATPSTTLFDISSGSPSGWTLYGWAAVPPADACFFKVKITGGVTDSAAGTARFDRVTVCPEIVDTVVGTGAGTLTSSQYVSDLYMGGSSRAAVSWTYGSWKSLSFAISGVAGGSSYAVDLRESTTARLTVTITLPAGTWTVWASGSWLNGNGTDTGGETDLSVMAIREA